MILHTERLDLVPLLAETLTTILGLDPIRAMNIQKLEMTAEFLSSLDASFMAKQLDGLRARRHEDDWFIRAVVRRADATVIGHCGFHGPPVVAGRAEMGYNILVPYRGNAFATEAARGLVSWALARDVRTLAAVAPDNIASQRVVEKLGFHQTGVRTDAPGQQMRVFEFDGELAQ